jgi:hypothetical protein
MKTKNLVTLSLAALVLGVGAYFTSSNSRVRTPKLNGKRITCDFNISDVGAVEIAGKLRVSATADGWKVDSKYGYPASIDKVRENVLKLHDLKVGQVARRTISNLTKVEIKDLKGKALASIELGDKHMSKPRGQMTAFGGGYPDARYLKFEGQTVLVKDSLPEFDGDLKSWADTRICEVPSAEIVKVEFSSKSETLNLEKKDSSWLLKGLGEKEELDSSKTYSLDGALSYLDFADIADPKLTEAELGFTTGSLYRVTLKNGKSYTAALGNELQTGERYFKVSASFSPAGTNSVENASLQKEVEQFNKKVSSWTYVIASYSASQMTKKRSDLVKAKEEPKKKD